MSLGLDSVILEENRWKYYKSEVLPDNDLAEILNPTGKPFNFGKTILDALESEFNDIEFEDDEEPIYQPIPSSTIPPELLCGRDNNINC
jgi:hypothetical protein